MSNKYYFPADHTVAKEVSPTGVNSAEGQRMTNAAPTVQEPTAVLKNAEWLDESRGGGLVPPTIIATQDNESGGH